MSGPTKVVKTKLFIGNLDPATQPAELTELFAAYGSILEASVIKDYGFVHFGSIEEAEKAVAALNNKEFHGKRLRVELSTSTVRHRPGQPEPASALRNSRARAAAMSSGNGVSRYSPAAPTGGVGPMRHSASAWARGDARPYDGIPMDPSAMSAGYGPVSSTYDRQRSYDIRSDPRHYYPDRRDSGYGSGYDASRDNLYGAPGYVSTSGSSAGQAGIYSMRDYRDLQPHVRADSLGYSTTRVNRSNSGIWTSCISMYDRNPGTSPVDPYYGGSLPQGPPAPMDPYQNYDYQKFYTTRPRESEYPVSTGQNPPSREYDIYTNYRADPYASATGQGPPLRHDPALTYQQQQLQAGYPPPTQQRQQPTYGGTSGAPTASYPPNLAQYYGAQQRA
ncbi:unnamed protein product [Adineta steineri]|uniref:RRM domain-containing protein n=1 Tax=Adineta steineri TaxID=433720 RepID=A0A814MBR6_9BILA|nr:unnamed protein product [Adineta steineri]CAF3789540.1 unnamed protein product [Adineta steineri]